MNPMTERERVHESLHSQVDRLAKFIMEYIPGEPSQNEGAIDTAIRLLAERAPVRAQLPTREEIAGMLSTMDFKPSVCHPATCVPMADALLREITARLGGKETAR